ncbi:type IV secretory pathway VirJ component [Sphingobium sp. B7D2B]|uniref:virulence factor n=1 Tax=Sphingobium sp. B7D2B TaxID=2940583 RepID=UPI002225AAA1|nr:virulence factor [Sphingobium sp. B7D2B]MCW2366540.1 type IV secretory pathway VirJ component [Sphingobium sp. B7D2B]
MRKTAITLAALMALVLMAFDWLGYLGSDPFTVSRPAGYQPRAGTPVAIIFSGDMGFRVGMGPKIAERLEAAGTPVVGVNSLTYYRQTRTPSEAAALIIQALAQARAVNPQGRVVLIGQSFGADMLHVGLANLPEAQRRDIALAALFVPGATVEYRASPSEVLSFWETEHDALPTARTLSWLPLLCVYGKEEPHSLCPRLHLPNLRSQGLPGGHQLNWDVEAVTGLLFDAMTSVGIHPHG